jgi:predicted ATPase/DNA-binding CsgD family transcriptional regulator
MNASRGVGDAPETLGRDEPVGDAPRLRPGEAERVLLGPARIHHRGRVQLLRPNHNLPEPLSGLIGREEDVAAVAAMVSRSRLVTVAGPGGIGKTRVALAVARAQLALGPAGGPTAAADVPWYPNGAWLVELAPVTDGALVPHAVLSEVLGPPPANAGATHDLVDTIRERRALLVLDNCEHLREGCAALVSRLLRACPNLHVFVTSREPLRVTGERVWWLEPLPVPAAGEGDVAVAAGDAVELFVERARDVAPGFALGGALAPCVVEICRRLDGLPLAIELAAARAAVLSPAEILDRLDDRFHLLTGGSADAEPRHKTLRATLEWSHGLLSATEAVVFRRLAAFAVSWSLAAAEQVCSGEGVAADEVLDVLGALRAKSLIGADEGTDTTRYRMLETVREYARDRLRAAGEENAILRRHASWCVARAERAEDSRDREHEAWLERLDEDADNFRAALVWARDAGEAETGLRLANALTWFWQTRGNLQEALEWLQWGLSSLGEGRTAARAKALRNVGRIVHTLGDHDRGLAMIDRSVALFREVGNTDEAGGCVCHDLFQMCRNPLHAIPAMERNLAAVRAMDDPNRLAHALSNLGLARFFRGDAAGAKSCFVEVLGLRPAGIDGDAAEQALMGVARVALLTGEYREAETALLEVLEHGKRVGDPDAQSAALSMLGELSRARGDTANARRLLAEALRLAREAGAALSIGRCELLLAGVELADGALEPARALYAQAMRRVEAGATLAYHQVRCELGLADVALASGKIQVAASLYADTHDAARANGDDQGVARALSGQAAVARASGDVEEALRLRHAAIELEERIGDVPAITRSLEALARLATLEERFEKAARLFGAASGLRDRLDLARPARLEAAYQADLVIARQNMEPSRWDDAWEQGRRLSVKGAVAYARKGRGRRRRPASGWESLTPAERDVVALVVAGLTNPEVGERLFISRRTVGHHLDHVYAKLGIHSRRELVREALSRARHGWPGSDVSGS